MPPCCPYTPKALVVAVAAVAGNPFDVGGLCILITGIRLTTEGLALLSDSPATMLITQGRRVGVKGGGLVAVADY